MATTTKKRSLQAASDYVPSSGDGETWVRRFKDSTTQIRICPAERTNARGVTVYGTDAWPTSREHYSDDAGSWPCAESLGGTMEECSGCQDEDPKVQDRRRQYYINAVDEQGEYRIFKMGAKLYKTFQAREQRLRGQNPENKQPLSDRDYLINKMGRGLDTTYDPEPGDKYEYDFDETRFHDIDEVLIARADDAEAIYAGESPTMAERRNNDRAASSKDDDDDTPRSRQAAKKTAAKKTAARREEPAAEEDEDEKPVAKKAAAKRAEPEPESEQSGGNVEFATESDIDDAETTEIRDFLDAHDVEYPARAPRSRLVKEAKAWLKENPPY